jgi:hypothetical protein
VIDPLLAVLMNRDGLIQIHLFGAPAMHVDLLVAVNDFGAVTVDGVELVAVNRLPAVLPTHLSSSFSTSVSWSFCACSHSCSARLFVFKADGVGVPLLFFMPWPGVPPLVRIG